MGAVMPATASSLFISRAIARNPLWNNRIVVVVVCLASALLFIYHLFRAKTIASYLPNLNKRLITEIFPENTLQKLPFEAPFAQGIIQIPSLDQTDLSIVCLFDNRPFFHQPITDRMYLPELPYQKEITIQLHHQQKIVQSTRLLVSHRMGIYEMGAEKSNSLPQLHSMQGLRPLDSRNPTIPLSIAIDVEDVLKIQTSSTSIHQFQNSSFFTHILFFKIRGHDPSNPPHQHFMILPVLVPCGNKSLPLDFFHQCWMQYNKIHQKNSFSHPQLEILAMQVMVIPWGRELLQ